MTWLVLIAGMFVAGVSGLLIGCLMSAGRGVTEELWRARNMTTQI
jgi:hypothetical protein